MVKLALKEQFEEALENYQPNAEVKAILDRIPLVIMLGVSGSGRNTIINHLLSTDRYHFVVSDTTRPPKLRDGAMEQDGVNYNFRNEEEVLKDIKAGMYIEAEIIHNQQVSGANISEITKAADSGKIPINEVDLGGTEAIYRAKPDTKFFFVVPPSFEEWMYRLKGREVMSEEEFHNRIRTALKVLERGLSRDEFIFTVNDSSYRSSQVIDAVLHGQEFDEGEHQRGRDIARQLQIDTERHLSTH